MLDPTNSSNVELDFKNKMPGPRSGRVKDQGSMARS